MLPFLTGLGDSPCLGLSVNIDYAGDGYDCDNDVVGGYRGVGDNDGNNAPLRPGVHQLNFTLIAGVGEGAAVFGRLQVFSPSFSSSSVALIKMPLCLEYTILAAVTPFFCQTLTKKLLFFPLHTSILLNFFQRPLYLS